MLDVFTMPEPSRNSPRPTSLCYYFPCQALFPWRGVVAAVEARRSPACSRRAPAGTLAAPIAVPQATTAAPVWECKFPTVSVSGAALILGCREKEVWNRLEDGSLQNAFNLATRLQGKRRLIRVLARSIVDFKTGAKSALSITDVLNLIFPAPRQRFSATEVAWAFACDGTHIHNLIASGALDRIAGTGDPINRAPWILRSSLADFLISRQIT